jgi:hypothetical protein
MENAPERINGPPSCVLVLADSIPLDREASDRPLDKAEAPLTARGSSSHSGAFLGAVLTGELEEEDEEGYDDGERDGEGESEPEPKKLKPTEEDWSFLTKGALSFRDMSYRELQAAAKKMGLNARMTTDELRTILEECFAVSRLFSPR